MPSTLTARHVCWPADIEPRSPATDSCCQIIVDGPETKQNLSVAQYTLARMYKAGIGVPQDLHEAAELYRKAAAHGIVAAQNEPNAMSSKN
ncbi:tetratricopeptide repeat protein [Paraburkholderia sediminicola]|uniref:tetratricopeptide repeat protein n=1 Tax=Paraburkholderia sediminicola TaxID=458836 RepID=UPI0038B7597B